MKNNKTKLFNFSKQTKIFLLFLFVVSAGLLYTLSASAYFTVVAQGKAASLEEARNIAIQKATEACGGSNQLSEHHVVQSGCTHIRGNVVSCEVQIVGICR